MATIEGDERRRQFDRMARLARAYRGWTIAQMNDAFGRNPARPAPDGSDPKLDLVARLARALEWDLGDVAERVWSVDPRGVGDDRDLSFGELDARAQAEHRAGDFAAMERTGLAMRARANNGRERAVAANRLAGAYDGAGRYAHALAALRGALDEPGIGGDVRLMLTVNIANANYALWNLDEARALADTVLERFESAPPRGRLERVAEAFGHAIRGHATRRLVARAEAADERERLGTRARCALEEARARYDALALEFGDPQYEGLAHAARGGVVEARVAEGALSAEDGVGEILGELDRFVDVESAPSGHLIESAGWWAVFGANIALRGGIATAPGLAEDPSSDQAFAICTNKALEIGDRLGHWPLRERAFTLEWFRRQVAMRVHRASSAEAWTLDRDDLRALVGAMGRFPFFRPTGWAILDSATLTA